MKTFWQSVLAALIGGAATGAASFVTSGGAWTGKNVGGAAIAGALVGVGGLLKSSPLSPKS
jgi:hypothetical protein